MSVIKSREDPLVSIIISFKNQFFLLNQCIQSIIEKTSYSNYEIILVNNDSDSQKLKEIKELISKYPQITLIDYNSKFNFSKINNLAEKHSQGEYLLFLNNDTKVINSNWIESLLEVFSYPNVGIAGAKLFFPNGNIQHAGIVLYKNFPLHGFYNLTKKYYDSSFLLTNIQEYPAVTGACMMITKKLFKEFGGFDENFAVLYNDVDLCLKAWNAGYRVVWTPYAQLVHYESQTRIKNKRKSKEEDIELDYFFKKWSEKDVYPNYNFYNRFGIKLSFFSKLWASLMKNKLFYNLKRNINLFRS